MNQRSTSRLCLLVAVLCPLDVLAVVPARVTRFQRILSFLPQVVSLFAAALLAILLWRKRAKIANHFRAKPSQSVVQLAAVAVEVADGGRTDAAVVPDVFRLRLEAPHDIAAG